MKKLLSLSLVASSFLLADTDLEQLKKQMDRQQLTIEKLQEKIEKLEQTSALKEKIDITTDTKQDEAPQRVQTDTTMTQSKTFGQSKFMPDISLIVDTSYVSRSQKMIA